MREPDIPSGIWGQDGRRAVTTSTITAAGAIQPNQRAWPGLECCRVSSAITSAIGFGRTEGRTSTILLGTRPPARPHA
jgi:hypothetical protein